MRISASPIFCFWVSRPALPFCCSGHRKPYKKREDELSIAKKIWRMKEILRVLSVEWDYLNRPQRLGKIGCRTTGHGIADVR